MGSRITTGFHRLGIVLAVPLLLAALTVAYWEWKDPSGDVQREMLPGTLGVEVKEIDPYSRILLTEQRSAGMRVPRGYVVVGIIGTKRFEKDGRQVEKRLGADGRTLFTLRDGRVIAIKATNQKELLDCAFDFLWREKKEGHPFSPENAYSGQTCNVSFDNPFDQFAPATWPVVKVYQSIDYFLPLILAGCAAGVYILCLALAWVFSGFAVGKT